MTFQRNLLYATVIALGFSACQTKPVDNNAIDLNAELAIINKDTLSIDIAKKYVKNYSKRAVDVDSIFSDEAKGISSSKKVPDTRAVWFSIKRLKALVKKIESEGGDGIRFYYATYDSLYNARIIGGNRPDRAYWNHNTLIMVSTRDSLAGKYHRDYYENKKKKGYGFILGSSPENRGEMCPPPANCTDIGATLVNSEQ